MKLGVYNAILHDRPLPEALKVIADLGLTGIEINTGGFLPAVHVPDMDQILESDAARDDYLGLFEGTGVSIAGLNCNGNPLHPKREIGQKHAEDIRRSIRLAERLGQTRVERRMSSACFSPMARLGCSGLPLQFSPAIDTPVPSKIAR